MILTFFVRGVPVAYARPRVATSTFGKLRFVTPTESRDWQHQLASVGALVAQRDGWPFARGPLTVTMVVRRPIPPSTPRKRAAAMVGTPCTVRPDADNYLKQLDALTGILWQDDAQITDARVQKFWALPADAGVAVTVTTDG